MKIIHVCHKIYLNSHKWKFALVLSIGLAAFCERLIIFILAFEIYMCEYLKCNLFTVNIPDVPL